MPTPDWRLYASDPGSIPATCVGGVFAGPEATLQPTVTTFSPDFTAPRSWRASLGYQTSLLDRLTASLDLTYARGVGLYGVRDLNLDGRSTFSLADEGGRPFFGDPSAIVPETGRVSLSPSRIRPEFGHVFDIGSDLESSTTQIVASAGGLLTRQAFLQVGYSYMRSTDQSSFSCCSAVQGFQGTTTAGNPNDIGWATSSFERTHSFTALLAYPLASWLDVSLIGRLSSGTPFTPLVGGDVNGDGVRNDQALVFGSEASDPVIAGAWSA